MKKYILIVICIFFGGLFSAIKFCHTEVEYDLNSLLIEADECVVLHQASKRNYFGRHMIPSELKYISSLSPQFLAIREIRKDLYEVELRLSGGFCHKGLLILSGAGSIPEGYYFGRGLQNGWENTLLQERVIYYEE